MKIINLKKINMTLNIFMIVFYLWGFFETIIHNYQGFIDNIGEMHFFNILLFIIICVFLTIINRLRVTILLIVIKVIIIKAIQKRENQPIKNIDKAYFRDILMGFSPAELCYMDKFCIDNKNDVVATLLNMQLKKAISIDGNNHITFDQNKNLLRNEKYLFEKIPSKAFSYSEFQTVITKDLLERRLIEQIRSTQALPKKSIIASILIALMFISPIIGFMINTDISKIVSVIISVLLFGSFFAYFVIV